MVVLFVLIDDSFVLDCPLIVNFKHKTFICAQLFLPASNSTISGILIWHINLDTSNYHSTLEGRECYMLLLQLKRLRSYDKVLLMSPVATKVVELTVDDYQDIVKSITWETILYNFIRFQNASLNRAS